MTEIMPSISVNSDPARGRVPKSAAMASTKSSALSSTSGQQPVDAVASQRDVRWAVGDERLPLTVENGAHLVALAVDRPVEGHGHVRFLRPTLIR